MRDEMRVPLILIAGLFCQTVMAQDVFDPPKSRLKFEATTFIKSEKTVFVRSCKSFAFKHKSCYVSAPESHHQSNQMTK